MAHGAVQTFYRQHAGIYDWTRWAILHGRGRAVARLQLPRAGRVLEVGCGTGLNFRFLQAALDPVQGRIVGLDFSADMLRVAERRLASARWANVELQQADATAMRFAEKFDGVLFAYSLTMIPEWPAALARAAEALKPGGRAVVLDFSRFHGWGPLAPAMRAWLRANHVETLRPYEEQMREHFAELDVFYWLGGYNFTAVGRKRA